MNAGRTRRQEAESLPQIPQSTPFHERHGQYGHDYTLQAVIEMQKSIGELNANVQALKGSIDGVKSKVDDLVSWKHKIIGGAIVLGMVGTGLGVFLGKASEYLTFKSPQNAAATPAPTQAPATPAATPAPPGTKKQP